MSWFDFKDLYDKMNIDQELKHKKAVVFDFDDVLYPKLEFLLQVYYLFSNFVEYTKGEEIASQLLNAFRVEYEASGEIGIWDRVSIKHPLLLEFEENYQRLHHQAQLPLKIHLYPGVVELLKKLEADHKFIIILTAGDPLMQLNKIRQVEWQGLEERLKVYFEDELYYQNTEPLDYLMETLNLSPQEMSYIGHSATVLKHAHQIGIDVKLINQE